MREIAALLGVSVASVSRWTADITLSPGFTEACVSAIPPSTVVCRDARTERGEARRPSRTRKRADANWRAQPTRLHLAGCMLYWAEGSKDRNTVKLTNSDPDLVAMFVRFLRSCYAVALSGSR